MSKFALRLRTSTNHYDEDEINADYLLYTQKFGIKMDISWIPTFTHLLFVSFFCKALQDF